MDALLASTDCAACSQLLVPAVLSLVGAVGLLWRALVLSRAAERAAWAEHRADLRRIARLLDERGACVPAPSDVPG